MLKELAPGAKAKLIISIDMDSYYAVRKELDGLVQTYKVGTGYTTCLGNNNILRNDPFVFIDEKYHNTPGPVRKAAYELTFMGAKMFTVMAEGGVDMMKAAVEGVNEGVIVKRKRRPIVLAATVLTTESAVPRSSHFAGQSVEQAVYQMAQDAAEAGLDGVVCSGHEVAAVRRAAKLHPGFLAVVAGIRRKGDDPGKQKRIMTPTEAIEVGADYLIVGDPICNTKQRRIQATAFLAEISDALYMKQGV